MDCRQIVNMAEKQRQHESEVKKLRDAINNCDQKQGGMEVSIEMRIHDKRQAPASTSYLDLLLPANSAMKEFFKSQEAWLMAEIVNCENEIRQIANSKE